MYLRRILTALPVLALVHVVACSDQEDDKFPTIPPNADAADSGTTPPDDSGGGQSGPTHINTIFIIVMENHNWNQIKP